MPAGGAITLSLNILSLAGNQPVSGPAFPVPDGFIVEVSPYEGNVSNAYVSTSGRDAALNGPRIAFAQTANPREIDVRNLSDLWVYGGIGGGVTVVIRSGPNNAAAAVNSAPVSHLAPGPSGGGAR